jgi:hypothetical protein
MDWGSWADGIDLKSGESQFAGENHPHNMYICDVWLVKFGTI